VRRKSANWCGAGSSSPARSGRWLPSWRMRRSASCAGCCASGCRSGCLIIWCRRSSSP